MSVGDARRSLSDTLQLGLLDRVVDEAPSTVHDLLTDSGLGDGLPPGAVRSADLATVVSEISTSPDAEIGRIPPLRTPLTARQLAVCALLAGCRPEQARLLVAMVRGLGLEDLNAYGVLTTTGTAAIMAIVNGPVSTDLGYRSGTNCLGPGNRPNATAGRFLSLVTRIVGGAREGVADMATMGQPGKYTFCFAEAEGQSPWPSLTADQGFAAGASAVTLAAVTGTVETFDVASYGATDLVRAIARSMVVAEPPAIQAGGSMSGVARSVVLLSPEWAHALAAAGMGKQDVRAALAEAAADHPAAQHPDATALPLLVVCGGPGVKQTVAPIWSGGSAAVTVCLEPTDDTRSGAA